MEGEEVGALLALDVDHLDELAGAHLVGERGRGVDAEVEPRLGERWRELLLLVAARRRAAHLDEELGRRRRAVDDAPGRSGDDDRHRALRAEGLCRAGGRPLAEQPDRERLGRVEATRAELVREQARRCDRPAPRGSRVAGASAFASSAAASSRPSAPSTETSATWLPRVSTTVIRSSGPRANTVAPPGGRGTSRRTGPPGAARERDRVSR